MTEIFWHNLSIEEVAKILKTDLREGLDEKEVNARQSKFGKNLLPEEKPLSGLKIFLEQFRSPLIYILVIAGVVVLVLREFTDAIVIFGAVFLNIIFGFFQENKVSKTLRALKKMVWHEAEVLREGNLKIIDSEDLVPGDIVILNPGNKVPADGRLIESHNLKINEAPLTGEWITAEKEIEILVKETPLADRENMVYLGCVVEEGRGRVLITETGIKTEIGKISQMVKEIKEEKTPYQKKVIHLSKLIGILIVFISFLILILGVAAGRDFSQMFLTAVAVAVAAIPEGLPVSMTIILALGMQRILKKGGLVRKMIAAETLGSTSIICTDKTGTLTEAKMQVAGIYTGTKELLSDGQKYSEEIDKNGFESHILALKIATLCNEAFIENSDEPLEEWVVQGRPTEKALLLAGIQAGLNKNELEREQPKIDELMFDPVYKYSATLHKLSEAENILYVLGAPEVISEKSEFLDIDGETESLSEDKSKELTKKCEELAEKGQRVLATAYKILRIAHCSHAANLNELPTVHTQRIENEIKDLIFVGFIALHDPIRKEVKEAIKVCREAGMRPIIVTGDHKLTARAIAEVLGLPAQEKNIIEGLELEKLSDEEFQKRLKDIEIYARVEPVQKLKIIEAWQKRGEVVAMTGDGINDAPALKKADIGIALGSGTEAAKEASDLILLNDSFSIIVAAVEQGRAILDNIRKVITYLLSDSFTEVILIGLSILAGAPLPISAVQILWVNLIEDGLPGIALAFEPKEKDLMLQKPAGHATPLLTREMKTLIFIIGFMTDLLLLGIFFWLLKFSGYEISHIRTIIFAGLAIDSLFYVFSCKSLRQNLWHINPFSNKFLVISWIFGIMALIGAIYLSPLQILLKTVPLNLFDWQLILGLGLLNIILIEVTKWYFIVRHKTEI